MENKKHLSERELQEIAKQMCKRDFNVSEPDDPFADSGSSYNVPSSNVASSTSDNSSDEETVVVMTSNDKFFKHFCDHSMGRAARLPIR
ncbi:hypothetical protein QE152_g23213 [Popillia japonica]|uniref:Uncharacterized protein n=1 Tax=Popillia japonica TaxID=7064 RepID=A0AAW1KHK0_POPJA